MRRPLRFMAASIILGAALVAAGFCKGGGSGYSATSPIAAAHQPGTASIAF